MKYVLVTGANGGMGKSTVDTLASMGYGVFALDKNPCPASENVFPIEADITNESSLQLAYEKVCEKTNELYAVIHFAGIYLLNSLVEISEKDFSKIFDVNVFGAYRINKIFLPLLKKGSKIIITTSELAPLAPLPFTGLYAVTKSALDKYAYSLRMEVQLQGIFVSVLRPGAVETDMLDVSTTSLNNFCENTSLYKFNAEKFKAIVNKVETRKVPTKKIADKTVKILKAKKPKFVYKLNRNPLLLLLSILPKRTQTNIIKKILKNK